MASRGGLKTSPPYLALGARTSSAGRAVGPPTAAERRLTLFNPFDLPPTASARRLVGFVFATGRSTSHGLTRRTEDSPPYLALGARTPSGGRAVGPPTAAERRLTLFNPFGLLQPPALAGRWASSSLLDAQHLTASRGGLRTVRPYLRWASSSLLDAQHLRASRGGLRTARPTWRWALAHPALVGRLVLQPPPRVA